MKKKKKEKKEKTFQQFLLLDSVSKIFFEVILIFSQPSSLVLQKRHQLHFNVVLFFTKCHMKKFLRFSNQFASLL